MIRPLMLQLGALCVIVSLVWIADVGGCHRHDAPAAAKAAAACEARWTRTDHALGLCVTGRIADQHRSLVAVDRLTRALDICMHLDPEDADELLHPEPDAGAPGQDDDPEAIDEGDEDLPGVSL